MKPDGQCVYRGPAEVRYNTGDPPVAKFGGSAAGGSHNCYPAPRRGKHVLAHRFAESSQKVERFEVAGEATSHLLHMEGNVLPKWSETSEIRADNSPHHSFSQTTVFVILV